MRLNNYVQKAQRAGLYLAMGEAHRKVHEKYKGPKGCLTLLNHPFRALHVCLSYDGLAPSLM